MRRARRHTTAIWGPACTALAALITISLAAVAEETTQPGAIIFSPLTPDFINRAPGIPGDNAASAFGGHTTAADAPSAGSVRIRSSSIGQPTGASGAIANFSATLRDVADDLLFFQPGAPSSQNDQAAFRYRQVLFEVDEFGQPQNAIAGNTASAAEQVEDRITQLEEDRDALLENLFGPDELAQVADAESLLRQALQFDPTDEGVQNLWLDIAYHQTEIALIKAREKIARGYRQCLFPSDPNQPIIGNEVAVFEEALDLLESAADPYFELICETLGISVEEFFSGFDNAADNPPYGLFVFKELVPRRSATSASLVSPDGGVLPVRPGEGQGNGITPGGKVFSAAKGSHDFTVLTDQGDISWVASESAPWLSLVNAGATGNATFTANVEANLTAASRTADITVAFMDGDGAALGQVIATIIQDANGPAHARLDVAPTILRVSPEGGVVTLDVTDNDPDNDDPFLWSASVAVGGDWLRIDTGSASGEGAGEISLSFDQNAGSAERLAAVRVTLPSQSGNPITVEITQPRTQPESTLYPGFKDYILLFEVFKEEARAASELIERLALRGGQEDIVRAEAVVRRILGPCASEGAILTRILDWQSPTDGAGGLALRRLTTAYNGWQTGLQELVNKDLFIKGERNFLGFDPEFLMLVQEFQRLGISVFDSFDSFILFNDPGAGLSTPLGFALARLDDARGNYFNYRENLDALKEQFRVQNSDARDRLREITGVDPGSDIDNPEPAYLTPEGNLNGEIALQELSIDAADTRVAIGAAEGDVLAVQIENEALIRDAESDTATDIRGITIDYGQRAARQEVALGYIEGGQALADQVAEAIVDISGVDGVSTAFSAGGNIAAILIARGINGVAQFGAEVSKGYIARQQALNAAQEQAAINTVESDLQEFIRDRMIADLNAQTRVNSLQVLEANTLLQQENARKLAILSEQNALEQSIRENDEALVERLFADPIHRTLFQADLAEAQRAFEVAQRWAFFTVRALEYKWNTPFVFSQAGKDFSIQSVFSARNAEELLELTQAMIEYDGLLTASGRGDVRLDVLSFTEDILGLDILDEEGETILYRDPANPEMEVPAVVLFRRHLVERTSSQGVITLRFSTVKSLRETFFRGPSYDENNNLIERGLYLDKIVSMQVNLPGTHLGVGNPNATPPATPLIGAPTSVPAVFTYAGTSFIRNAQVGERILGQEDEIENEYILYPTRFWFFDAGNPDRGIEQGWKFRDGQEASVTLNLTQPGERDPNRNLITVFRERSVATSDWILQIFTRNGQGERILDIGKLNDIELVFEHAAKDRP